MNKKILYGFLPIFLSLVVLLVPMRALAAVGAGSDWDGVVSLSFLEPDIYLDFAYDLSTQDISGIEYPRNTQAVYKSSANAIASIQMNQTDVYLNGYLRKRITFQSETLSYATLGRLQAVATPIIMDNIFITFEPISRDWNGKEVVDCYIYFNNYYVNSNTLKLPMLFDITANYSYQIMDNYAMAPYIHVECSVSDDWAGEMMQYDNLEDVPSVDGYLSQQNQTIINQSQTQNNLINEQNTLIQNQTQTEIQNSQNEINQSIQNTDQITNGYNSSQMGDAENKFESGAGDLTDIEDTLSDSSSTYVDNFTTTGFDTSFLQSVGPSLNYVVTWFTNFWYIGGGLTATFNLSFAIYIAFYILRVRG